MPITSVWTYPTTVVIGNGAVAQLPELVRAGGARRPLVVTDPGVARLPAFQACLAELRAAFAATAVFSDLAGNPTVAQVAAGCAALQAAQSDLIIAFGGGSAIDAAKGIALAADDAARLDAFEWNRALEHYPLPTDFPHLDLLPLIAVPTTAGTGSELGRDTVLVDASGTKRVHTHPELLARAVVLDAGLTVGLPPALTAATGMDALTHHLEAYCSPLDHPMADGVALEGLRLVRAHLLAAFRDGSDIRAREGMLKASALGAVAFQKGLGGTHALAHALGGLHGLHHGLLNAVLVPYVLRANASAIAPRMGRLARDLDLERPGVEGVIDWLLQLRRAVGIAHTLAELGLDAADAERVGRLAVEDRSSADTNPIAFDAGGYAAIYRDAVAGRL